MKTQDLSPGSDSRIPFSLHMSWQLGTQADLLIAGDPARPGGSKTCASGLQWLSLPKPGHPESLLGPAGSVPPDGRGGGRRGREAGGGRNAQRHKKAPSWR